MSTLSVSPLAEREVLDGEQAAVGVEDVGILAAASGHVKAARTRRRTCWSRIGGDHRLARAGGQRDRAGAGMNLIWLGAGAEGDGGALPLLSTKVSPPTV